MLSSLVLRIFKFLFVFCVLPSIVSYNPIKNEKETDYSASAQDVRKLAVYEQYLIKVMTEYNGGWARRFISVRKYLDDFESSIGKLNCLAGIADLPDEISKHPLKTYRLVFRIVHILPKVLADASNEACTDSAEFIIKLTALQNSVIYPTLEDLENLMISIIRLKQTYNLPVKELAEGNLMGFKTRSGLTSQNCLEIAQKALDEEVLSTAIEFLETALHLDRKCNFTKTSLEKAILLHDKYLSSGKFRLDKNPFHFTTLLHSFNHTNFRRKQKEIIPIPLDLQHMKDMLTATTVFDKLCRQELIRNVSVTFKLTCKYYSSMSCPFCASKAEFHSINPPIIQFYDVLSELEMESLRKEAQNDLSRSRVLTTSGNYTGKATRFRSSTTTWILDIDGSPFEFINKRVEKLTGLDLSKRESKEILQMSNYAPGGFYTPHYDAIFEPSISQDSDESGDRLGTFMIYLSNVEKGGGTAFPVLGVYVEPVKGSAVFWYNLKWDGSINRQMLHGGCPVLVGNKWVANKWIRANDQMFAHKCPIQRPDRTP